MKKKNYLIATIFFITALVASVMAVPLSASAAPLNTGALQSTVVPLHRSHVGASNPGFNEETCPTPPAGQEGWWGWHFVMPANNNFTSLTVTFQNAGTFTANPFPGTTFVAHPDNSHAYVWTPGPDTLVGGSATSSGSNRFFVLSHVCSGDTPTETPTPTPGLGQLKVCKVAGIGVNKGDLFTIVVGTTEYSVPAGYCVLAGQYPLNTQLTVRENIPPGYFVDGINVLPGGRTVSMNTAAGEVVVRIGSGITEVSFRNANSDPTSTKTPIPGTPPPPGSMQICKEAQGAGVSGYFTFTFDTQYRSVPVGACSKLIFNLTPGTMTITEVARAGFEVVDIYTIPADRLVSKDISSRSVTVNIVAGDASSQTVIVFVNRAATP